MRLIIDGKEKENVPEKDHFLDQLNPLIRKRLHEAEKIANDRQA